MQRDGEGETTLDRTNPELIFEERFDGPALDPERWLPEYLPHWSTLAASAARYDVGGGGLRFRIDADQPAWREDEAGLRVSSLQTGSFAGPVGSGRGQMAHRTGLTVRTAVPTRHLFTPTGGVFEAALRAVADPTTMLAFWLVGVGDTAPEDVGEICVVELFGHAIGPSGSSVNVGVKAHQDPRLREDMVTLRLDHLDATGWHRYAADWSADAVRFFVDDQLVHTVRQSIDYPMQLMVDLFEFPPAGDRDRSAYPKTGDVGPIRVWRWSAGRSSAPDATLHPG